ncbi:hypothetical protein A2U01_0072029, partial [Trifolium medium]|nr:hypothetical protein [Trifolium medium]
SVAVFKLLEIVNYLNGRECQCLREKDAAQKKVNDLGHKLSEMKVSFDDYKNKYALQKELVTTLETTEAKLADVVKERDWLLQRVKELEDKILSLEGKLK